MCPSDETEWKRNHFSRFKWAENWTYDTRLLMLSSFIVDGRYCVNFQTESVIQQWWLRHFLFRSIWFFQILKSKKTINFQSKNLKSIHPQDARYFNLNPNFNYIDVRCKYALKSQISTYFEKFNATNCVEFFSLRSIFISSTYIFCVNEKIFIIKIPSAFQELWASWIRIWERQA